MEGMIEKLRRHLQVHDIPDMCTESSASAPRVGKVVNGDITDSEFPNSNLKVRGKQRLNMNREQ